MGKKVEKGFIDTKQLARVLEAERLKTDPSSKHQG